MTAADDLPEADPWAEQPPDDWADADPLPAERPSWAPINLTGVLDGSWQPPKPALFSRTDGVSLLYPGLTHSFHGEPSSGKSLVAQWLTAQLLGQNMPVAYLDYESDPGSVVHRIMMFGLATRGQIAEHLVYIRPEADPKANGGETRAFRDLARQSFALIVLDGVTGALVASRMESNSNDDVTRWSRAVPEYLAERTGAAVVMIDHVPKAAEGRGRFAIGAQAKLGRITGVSFTLEPKQALGQGLRGVVSIRMGKDRPGQIPAHAGPVNWSDRSAEVARFVLDSTTNPPRVTIQPPDRAGADQSFRPSTLMQAISKHLETATRPQSKKDVEGNVPGNASAKRQALDLLIREGYVTATPGARNALLHTSTRAYRATDDPKSDQFTGQPDLTADP